MVIDGGIPAFSSGRSVVRAVTVGFTRDSAGVTFAIKACVLFGWHRRGLGVGFSSFWTPRAESDSLAFLHRSLSMEHVDNHVGRGGQCGLRHRTSAR